MWVAYAVRRAGWNIAIPWQPMPAIAREPSGTRVEVLWGQPEQNQGERERTGAAFPAWSAIWSIRARRWTSRRSNSGSSAPRGAPGAPGRRSRAASARATMAAESSPRSGRSARPASSRLPTIRAGASSRL